ncbi:MAG: rhomboid family intramembrane serine protease [Chitinophagaceae bacterium]|nr:rhomboid family intramembrane serine protease [Chitinophagaceae bacterium]
MDKDNGRVRMLYYMVAGAVICLPAIFIMVSLWWHDKPVVAVGASGAIFGLYGIILAVIVFKVLDAEWNKFLLILLACTAGVSLVMGFFSQGVDNSAHVGGLVAGLVVGSVFAYQFKRRAGVGRLEA